MAAVEVPQTLEYRGGQLNVTLVLEVENFTNWKKRFMCHIIDDQINSVMNCLTAKSTWYDLILYHEGLSDVKESRVMDLKLCYNTFKFKEGLQDSPDDEEDTRSSHEYLNDLEEEYQARALLAKSKSFFKKGTQRPTKDFETKYNKVKAKLTLLSSSSLASKASTVKNKGLIAEAYEWDEEEVSSDDNEMVEVKVLMALAEDNDAISKEGARNGEWVKIYMRKVRTLLEMEDNDDRKVYLDYLCIDLNYVEEQRRVDKLTKDPSSSGQKDLVFVKSLADDTKVTILGVERPWLSEAEDYQINFEVKFAFKAEALKDVIISEPSSAPAKGNKSSSAIKVHSAPAGKFDEKVDDGYLLGYSLVSKEFRVFNTKRQQTKETYHITFDESPDAIKFSKPSVDNINIAKNKRYPPDEYLYPYDPSQRYQTNSNDVSFIEPYESPEPVVLETELSSDQNGH
nr:hypothetical protein [Tanacetum cinerariifolium]